MRPEVSWNTLSFSLRKTSWPTAPSASSAAPGKRTMDKTEQVWSVWVGGCGNRRPHSWGSGHLHQEQGGHPLGGEGDSAGSV